MTKFYVYEHWRPDTGRCFYVGKGKNDRAYRLSYRNRYHRAISAKLVKLGMEVEIRIVARGLGENEAFALEMERIAFWRMVGIPLVNQTAGGDGIYGFRHSPKTRQRQRLSALNSWSEERRASASRTLKGRGKSEKACANMSAGAKRRHSDPDERRKNSERIKAKWADPAYREKILAARRQTKKERAQEISLNMSAAFKEVWARPGYREKMSEIHKKSNRKENATTA